MKNKKDIKIGFFGTPEYAVMVLDILYKDGYKIDFIVTATDKPRGRNMNVTPTEAKSWGIKHDIDILQPEKLNDEEFINKLKTYSCDVFIVMAYGKIIPESILNIPKNGSLNIHPSLLPKFRGSCPIESTILNDDKNTGVTIIKMDKEMDHGPIVAIKEFKTNTWPLRRDILGEKLVKDGAVLMSEILPDFVEGKILPLEQNHEKATYTKKINKEDGLIDLNDDPYKNFLKIQAYYKWPSTYYFERKDGKDVRIKITEASFEDNTLVIKKVIPEGKQEISINNVISRDS